jgi:hypothetical protein
LFLRSGYGHFESMIPSRGGAVAIVNIAAL